MSAAPPSPRSRSSRLRPVGVLVSAAAMVALSATAASAHVRVHPDSTTTGGYSALTFRVPNESATASTVSLAVQLPQDVPFLSVSLKPVPGWKGTITKATLPKPVVEDGTTLTEAARTVTWTAVDASAAVAPGQYQEFSMSVGPLPSPRTILLPATQTYSDGSVVRWDEPTPASGTEPDHPAPALVVTPKVATAGSSVATSDPTSTASGSGSGNGLSVAALVVAVLAAVLAGFSVVTRRRGPTTGPAT